MVKVILKHGLPNRASIYEVCLRFISVIGLFAIMMFLSFSSEVFFTGNNMSVIATNCSLLLIVTSAMTLVIRSGGIDLSVGTAFDIGALTAVSIIHSGGNTQTAVLLGILSGCFIGLFNGFLIVFLKISPFLATLGTLYIGVSVQRILTHGGDPIYLKPSDTPTLFISFGRGQFLGLSMPAWISLLIFALVFVILERLTFGRHVTAFGLQPVAAFVSGLSVKTNLFCIYVLSSVICATAGVLLGARLTAYVPLSGDYFLLDAIGAVFIGTTLSNSGRPSALGSLIGALIFTVLANGMNLLGISFYFQGLARGLIIIFILGLSVRRNRSMSKLLVK